MQGYVLIENRICLVAVHVVLKI